MIILTDIINVTLLDLPYSIRGYTLLNSDGSYTITINSRLSYEKQSEVYKHELRHINGDDFSVTSEFLDDLEFERHAL